MMAIRWPLTGLFFGLLVVGGASPAGAEFEENTNGCFGGGTFQEGQFSIDADSVGDRVVTIPRSDTVAWQGSVTAPPGMYYGSIKVELPPPWGSVTIDSWKGDSQSASNTGTEEYDLPTLLPGGVEFKVTGEHVDQNGRCSGYVKLKVEGKPFSSPITWVSLFGTVATGAGIAFVARPLFRRVG